jgi:trimeric autotransporter adhesin
MKRMTRCSGHRRGGDNDGELGPMSPALRILALVLWLWASLGGCSAGGGMGGTGGGGEMPCTTPQDCPAAADECVTRTCLDGRCGTANVAAGTACNDGDACTKSDTCQGGACTGSSSVDCTALDPCHVTGTCDPATGMCSTPNAPDGTVCALASMCVAGSCTSNPITYVKASNTGADDLFGWSVALSGDGNTLAVGAPGEDSSATGINGNQADDSAKNAGAVYVFTRSGGTWSQQAYIKAFSSGGGDVFGGGDDNTLGPPVVALSEDGNTLAVGAPREDSNATGINGDQADDSADSAGAVYVFTRSGGTWSQQAYVKASNTGANDQFGSSVALSVDGNTLAVGALGEASNATGINGNQADDSADSAGAVYVFTRSGGTWSQQAYVKASNTGANDQFGFSVALSGDGNTLAVGAPREDSNAAGINGNQADDSANGAGAVYVFTRSGGTWSQQAYVKASNTGANDGFGWSVALSGDGNTLAVGAVGEDSNATGINGDQADDSANSAGAVYVFTRSGGTWSQQAYVKASNTGGDDIFGSHVALSGGGNTLAVGAFREASGATGIDGNQADNSALEAGAVYVFTRSGGTWSQQAYVKASNTREYDAFGYSVALSGDGNTLAVSAPAEDSDATGINGNQATTFADHAGAVYVY